MSNKIRQLHLNLTYLNDLTTTSVGRTALDFKP